MLWRKSPYVPVHAFVSIADQNEIRKDLLGIWNPKKLLERTETIEAVMEKIEKLMQETIQGIMHFLVENKNDVVYRPLFRGGKFKMHKEAIRLSIKLRFRGSIHELNKVREDNGLLTVANLNNISALLWWTANSRWE